MELERLIKSIMKEAEADGEPVTYEEAKEMAEMEIKASKIKNYTQGEKPHKKTEKVRKVDEEKGYLLGCVCTMLDDLGVTGYTLKTETEISFPYNGNNYTFKLTKHRPPKA